MSEQAQIEGVPRWDTSDRMRKALKVSGLGVQEMADYLDVSRNTVSTWINGRIEPSTQTLRLWALRTGVPFEWLQRGELSSGPTDPGGPGAGDPLSPYFRSPRGYIPVLTTMGNRPYNSGLHTMPGVERASA